MTDMGKELFSSEANRPLDMVRIQAVVLGQLLDMPELAEKLTEKAESLDAFSLGELHLSLTGMKRVLRQNIETHPRLEVVASIEPEVSLAVDVEEQLPEVAMQPVEAISEIIVLQHEEPQASAVVIDEPKTEIVEASVTTPEYVAKNALSEKAATTFMKIFGENQAIKTLTTEQADRLTTMVLAVYKAKNKSPKKRSGVDSQIERFIQHIQGMSDIEIARASNGRSTKEAAQVGRYSLIKMVVGRTTAEEREAILQAVLAGDESFDVSVIAAAVHDELNTQVINTVPFIIEQALSVEPEPVSEPSVPEHIEEDVSAYPKHVDSTSGFSTVVQTYEEKAEKPTITSIMMKASEFWADEDIESLAHLLGLAENDADIAIARTHIAQLMGIYLPYAGKAQAVPALDYEILGRITGYDTRRQGDLPLTLQVAQQAYGSRTKLKGYTVEDAFARTLDYLLTVHREKYIQGWQPTRPTGQTTQREKVDPTALLSSKQEIIDVELPVEKEAETVTILGNALKPFQRYVLEPQDVLVLEKHLTGRGGASYSASELRRSTDRLKTLINNAETRVRNEMSRYPYRRDLPRLDSKARNLLTILAGDRTNGQEPVSRDELAKYYKTAATPYLPELHEVDVVLEKAFHDLLKMLKIHG